MKKNLLIACIIIIASCSGSKPIAVPPGSFVFSDGNQKSFGSALITLKEIQDSRCPKNVNCIRAGEAIAVFNIVVANSNERNIQLCTGADCTARGLAENYTLHTDNHTYLFKLDSIAPYPDNGVQQADKKVYLSISQSTE